MPDKPMNEIPAFESNSKRDAHDVRMHLLANEYTNDELLLEVRRRGLLGRVEARTVVPGRYVQDGFPPIEQLRDTYERLASELVQQHNLGKSPRGAKVEEGYFNEEGRSFMGMPKDRKMTIALNYILEDPK